MQNRRCKSAQSIELLESRTLLSTYFVSPSGSNGNPGTLAAPFATIQRAADIAGPGDTVLVRAGTYRETVQPARSGAAGKPIVFKPYQNEKVVISGADVISGWSNFRGSIYQATQAWDRGDGNNQVFVDGRMQNEARWPNTSFDLSHPTKAISDRIVANYAGDDSTAVLTDADLKSFPADTWNGATIHFSAGERWVWQTGEITRSGGGSISFTYDQRTGTKSELYETPRNGNPYYLTGKFVGLDSPGEWFRDPSGALYLWTPQSDDPNGHVVEAKRRENAFDLSGVSDVTLQGFNVFAASIKTSESTRRAVIDGLNLQYIAHFVNEGGWLNQPSDGISLIGTDSVIRNCTIAYSAGNGVYLAGARNVVENNVIHDIGYTGANGAGVRGKGTDQLIAHNTVYNVDRNGIHIEDGTHMRVLYNLVHDVMLQVTDGGAIYTYGTDGRGSEIAYNRVYNIITGGFGGAGVYLDNASTHYIVHHNVSYNTNLALKMNDPSPNNQIYNNTLVGKNNSIDSNRKFDMPGSILKNNIFTAAADIGPDAVVGANLSASTTPRFVDAARGDFRLKSDSPAIDRGQSISPYTVGFAGATPDIGAFEFGRAPWVAGADLSNRTDTTAPAAPKSLTAKAQSTGVQLDWSDDLSADRFYYDVYAADGSSGSYKKLNSAPLTHSEIFDASGLLGVKRRYRVTTVDTHGNVAAAATTDATRPKPAAKPAAPGKPTLKAPAGAEIEVTWPAVAGAVSYRLERKDPGQSSFKLVASSLSLTSYVDAGVQAGRSYSYRVRSENSLGASAFSAAASIATPAAPAKPSYVRVVRLSNTSLKISWSDVSNEQFYVVERSRPGRPQWTQIRTFAANVTSFSDVNLPTSGDYFYRVRALNAGGSSGASAAVGPSGAAPTTPPTQPPPADQSLQSADIGDGVIRGTTKVVAAGTDYDITAAGRTVFGSADDFHFVYRPLSGDFDVRVQVAGLTAVTAGSKAGLMARESLAANARNVFSYASAGDGFRFSRRTQTGGDTLVAKRGTVNFPNAWVRLKRTGDTFTSLYSTDGVTWTTLGTTTQALPRTLYVGLAVCAQSVISTTTANFRKLQW